MAAYKWKTNGVNRAVYLQDENKDENKDAYISELIL